MYSREQYQQQIPICISQIYAAIGDLNWISAN